MKKNRFKIVLKRLFNELLDLIYKPEKKPYRKNSYYGRAPRIRKRI